MSKRRMLAATLAVAGLAGLGLIAAAPANAATSNCPTGAACSWQNQSYSTSGPGGSGYLAFWEYDYDFSIYNYNGTSINANDSMSSAYNAGTSQVVYYYQNWFEGGYGIHLGLGQGDPNLAVAYGSIPAGYNDQLSSGYFSAYR